MSELEAFGLGTLGLDPEVFYRLTPRELDAMARGQKRRVQYIAIGAGAGFGGGSALIDRFFDGEDASEMTIDEYRQLKARFGDC